MHKTRKQSLLYGMGRTRQVDIDASFRHTACGSQATHTAESNACIHPYSCQSLHLLRDPRVLIFIARALSDKTRKQNNGGPASSDWGTCRDVVHLALLLGVSGTRFQEHQEFPARMADGIYDTAVYLIALAPPQLFFEGMYSPREHAQRPPWKEEDGV